jgi:hypothetical protein
MNNTHSDYCGHIDRNPAVLATHICEFVFRFAVVFLPVFPSVPARVVAVLLARRGRSDPVRRCRVADNKVRADPYLGVAFHHIAAQSKESTKVLVVPYRTILSSWTSLIYYPLSYYNVACGAFTRHYRGVTNLPEVTVVVARNLRA